MSIYTDPERLASAWRTLADTAIEHGETPLLTFGLDSGFQQSCLNLLALARVARQNLGPQNPIVIAAGDGWLWLLATLVWRPDTAIERRSDVQFEGVDDSARMVLYAGGDRALYAATLNIVIHHRDSGTLPPGLDWSSSPAAAPGDEGAEIELVAPTLLADEFMLKRSASPADDWLHKVERWAGGLLALALLIAALLG